MFDARDCSVRLQTIKCTKDDDHMFSRVETYAFSQDREQWKMIDKILTKDYNDNWDVWHKQQGFSFVDEWKNFNE